MDVILDTCGLLSLIGLVEKSLSKKTLHTIQHAENVYVSSCSLFEISIKHAKGKLNIEPFDNALALWKLAVREYELIDLPVTSDIFYYSSILDKHHFDSFDRMIIAEAFYRKIAVVTYDQLFHLYKVDTIS